MKTPRLFLLLALLVGLGGCSTIRLAYNQAEHILLWKADDYFDLNEEQEHEFRVRFARLHDWHRATQLPEYVTLLDSAQQRLRNGAGEGDARWLVEAVKMRYRSLATQAHADAAKLLATLDDAQIRTARQRFDKANRKYASEHGVGAPPEEQRRLRAKRLIERIEHWTGPLDGRQKTRVRQLSYSLPLHTDAQYRERLRRQAAFFSLLQIRKSPEFTSRLGAWLIDWERSRDSEYRAQDDQLVEARARMYAQTLVLLSTEQRNHVATVIDRYRQTLRELAAEAPARHLAVQP